MTQGIIVSPANRGVQVVVTDENNVQLLVDSNRGVSLEIVPQPRIEVLVDKGVEGAQGPVGPQGPQGPQGTAATVAAGTTTTGLAGTNAIVTNSGTSSAAVFDFTIPRGDTGATGATGAGVATGGTTGQVLVKASNVNYDTTWATITGTLVYQGSWNASTNTPTLTSSVGTNGYYYVVGTSGSTNLNGITDWVVGDWAIFNGSVWQKIDNTDLVSSVNGQTGVVVLDAADVGALSTLTSTDGSVTITSPNATTRDLSVAISGSTTNVVCLVRNTTGATLTKGTVVYISGATGQNPTVSKALATSDATSAQTLGMMTADLANNSNGYVTVIGLITNIDTSAYTDGQQLYLSGTTAGAVTGTKPYAPIHLVYVAVVEHAHPTQGKLFVKVQNGYELDELHNVSAQTPTNGQTIVYNSTTQLWEQSNAPIISGTTIDNTVIGGTTPAAGTFTTLTATGQTSLGGVAGSESVIVPVSTTSGTTVLYAFGGASSGIAGSRIFSGGSASNSSLNFGSKGSGGTIRFFTSATDVTGTWSNNQFQISHTASAVNYHQLTGSATGSGPIHSVAGSDTNIDLNATSKGTGSVNLNTGSNVQLKATEAGVTNTSWTEVQGGISATKIYANGSGSNIEFRASSKGTSAVALYTNAQSQLQLNVAHTASAVNYVQVTGASTTNGPTITAQGSDANIGIVIRSKGIFNFGVQNGSGLTSFVVNMTAGSIVNYLEATASTTGNAVRLSAQGSDTNIPLVLQPKGTGALQAQQTDSTATGGNARGANAVDWQTSRSSSTAVASGAYSVLSGGQYNASSGYQAVVSGGSANTANNFVSFIGGGQANTASGQLSSIVGGNFNTSAGFFNFIGSGQSNSGTSSSTVTTQSGTMNGTTAVTLSGSNANIKVGQLITGTNISTYPNYTYVAAISGTSLTLSQVASGSSTSTLSFFTPHGVVVGGGNNQATGSYSFIGGGGDAGTAANRNVASGDYSVVVGGVKNVASGLGGFVGGGGILSQGQYFSNTASGISSSISGGFNNTASGNASTIVGGASHIANSQGAVIGGARGSTRGMVGYIAFPACVIPIQDSYVSQAGLLVLGRQTTDATATVLCSDFNGASTANQLILPNNSAYYFKGSVIANVTGAANGAAWDFTGAIMRGANAASTVLMGVPAINRVAATAGATAWVIALTADTTNGGLAVTVTGAASTTIRWVCKAETTEVTF
jgi:hypothetical protein